MLDRIIGSAPAAHRAAKLSLDLRLSVSACGIVAIRIFRQELQSHLLALLTRPPEPTRIRCGWISEIHVSWIHLTGVFAYKIKRPVRSLFVDQCSRAPAVLSNEEVPSRQSLCRE